MMIEIRTNPACYQRGVRAALALRVNTAVAADCPFGINHAGVRPEFCTVVAKWNSSPLPLKPRSCNRFPTFTPDLRFGARGRNEFDPKRIIEPPRLYRRLFFLRGFGNEQVDTVFAGGPRAG